MQQENHDPSILDKAPNELVPLKAKVAATTDVKMVTCDEHPIYAKYFKMLKVGLPKESVKAKMKLEGVDSTVLDRNPKDLIPLENPPDKKAEEDMIAVQDHPVFSKYFKMLKVGLAKEAVKAKMTQEGVDPSYIDKDPLEMIPKSVKKTGKAVEVQRKEPQLRKKRLHWRAIDPSKLGANSLWGDKDIDEDIQIDEEEFQKFFVERYIKIILINCVLISKLFLKRRSRPEKKPP